MKKLKYFVLGLLVSVAAGSSLTSCLKSDSAPAWDYATYVTVPDGFPSYGLLSDDGYTFNPTNPSALEYTNQPGTYVKRAVVYLKFAEGEEFTTGKVVYNATIVDASGITTEAFNTRVDTLVNDYSLMALSDAWGANGYINVGFDFRYTESSKLTLEGMFDAYDTDFSDEGVLSIKLRQSNGGGDAAYQSARALMSFKVPSRSQLMANYPTAVPLPGDSVIVKITAKGSTDSELKTSPETFKIRLY
jgi:hypothetical protein